MAKKVPLYNLWWPPFQSPLSIEMEMIQKGGQWIKKTDGLTAGNGMAFHFKRGMQLCWPWIKWHRWFDLFVDNYLSHRTMAVIGAASCVAGETKILNPLTGDQPTIEELYRRGVNPTVLTLRGPVVAGIPFVKGCTDLFQVCLKSGRRFTSTAEHRVLTPHGYVCVSSLQSGSTLLSYEPIPSESISESDLSTHSVSVPNSCRTVPNYQAGCPVCFCSCDEPPQFLKAGVQDAETSPIGAQEHNVAPCELRLDGRADKGAHIHLDQRLSPLSIGYCVHPSSWSEILWFPPASLRILPPGFGCFRLPKLFESTSGLPDLEQEQNPCSDDTLREFEESYSWLGYTVQRDEVASVKFVRRDLFYDLTVPNYHHYFAEGAIHHNTGKTFMAAASVLFDYYNFPTETTIIICSDTMENLQNRIFGEMKMLHKNARVNHPGIPGHLIEGRLRIVTDDQDAIAEGRDFRNGIVGMPMKNKTGTEGIGNFTGVKNKRVRLVGDELHLLSASFVSSISNLDKNPDFKCIGMGNPKDTLDALGVLAEPAQHLGGWDGGIDQHPSTKVWETRRPDGCCLQLIGSESPNLDGNFGCNLITQEAIDRDIAYWGKESLQFTMMNEGRMPRGQGARRVITRQEALKHHANSEPLWRDSRITKIGFMDAAFGGVGGDRCIFGELNFGEESVAPNPVDIGRPAFVDQPTPDARKQQILALIDTVIVPVNSTLDEPPTDQIAKWVMGECERRGIPPGNFFYDSGMRSALVQRFGELWPGTQSIDCGGPASSERKVSGDIDVIEKDYYSKKVTSLWFAFRMVVFGNQFRGLTDDVLSEFCAREWGKVGSNKIEIEPKSEMKKKTGYSPDKADAVAVGIEGARQRGFVIRQIRSQRKEVLANETWKGDLREKSGKFWKSGQLQEA